MKKQVLYVVFLGMAALFFSACSITFPDSPFYDYRPYRIILQVEPSFAEVFVDGHYVGQAYEFSSERTSLRLASRRTEVLLALPGYQDEFVDLRAYSSRMVTVRLVMVPEPGTVPTTESRPAIQTPAENETAYQFSEIEAKEPPPDADPMLDPARYTEVVLLVNVEDASIYVNGVFWGLSPAGGRIENARLALGKNLFEVFKPGYQAFRREFTVNAPEKEGQKREIVIELQK